MQLTWIDGRKLNSYTDGNLSITYKYNIDGIRTEKTVNGITNKDILEGTNLLFNSNSYIGYVYSFFERLDYNYIISYKNVDKPEYTNPYFKYDNRKLLKKENNYKIIDTVGNYCTIEWGE
jgi:hypothetical protein